ncbi:tRNA (N6-threonylcarbamoyladenosine(37)-N6)-methyltransferase TrmO [Thalassotalea fusca]
MTSFSITPIGLISTPYKEKFAIPRQPGLVSSAKGKVRLIGEYNNPHMVQGLDQYSHIWLLFQFHETVEQGWKPLVRPPRLGGNAKTGVLATRSTFRPNGIGMSVVKLDKVTTVKGQVEIQVSGIDLLDNTPIVDIKPYIPYSDARSDAYGGIGSNAPRLLKVQYNTTATHQLIQFSQDTPELDTFIQQVLGQDPRPAYRKSKVDEKTYAMHVYNLNVSWRMIAADIIEVTSLEHR